MATPEPRFKNLIDPRNWDEVRDAWVDHVPSFPVPGAPPQPGLEHLSTLQAVTLPSARARYADVPGLRRQVLWEAVFQFHKCAHTHLASQRLGARGMHGWALFNAYHSAFLGARAVLSLVGVAFPFLAQGGQLFLDLYPPPEKGNGRRGAARDARDFLLVRLPPLKHTHLWEALIRALRITRASRILKGPVLQELTDLDDRKVSAPRNRFLYHAHYWPSTGDLLSDASGDKLDTLLSSALNPEETGFLLRLSCHVYRVAEALINDLAAVSEPIRRELEASRIAHDPMASDLAHYRSYVAGVPLVDSAIGSGPDSLSAT